MFDLFFFCLVENDQEVWMSITDLNGSAYASKICKRYPIIHMYACHEIQI